MQMRFAVAVVLIACAGCSSGPYTYAPPGPAGTPPRQSDLPPVVLRYANPSLVPSADHERVWREVVDVTDDYFRIDREEPIRVYGNMVTEGRIETFPETGATLLEPWRKDAADGYERLEGTFQSIRRHAVLKVTPAGNGFLVEINVFKELEDVPRPEHSTAGAATLRYDGSMTRIVNPVGEQPLTRGWIRLGRDPALEQRMMANLESRVGRLITPSSVPGAPGSAPPCATPGGCNSSSPLPPPNGPLSRATVPAGEGPGVRIGSSERNPPPATRLVKSTWEDEVPASASNPHPQPLSRSQSPDERQIEAICWVVARPALEQVNRLPATDCAAAPINLTLANQYAAEPAACSVEGNLPSCAPPPLVAPPQNATGCRFSSPNGLRGLFTDIGHDYGNFYSCRGLVWIGTTVGVGAVLANTSLDQDFQDWYQNDVRSSGTDDVARVAYQFGSGQYVIPAMAAAWLVGEWCCDCPCGAAVGQWGERSLRAVLVGGPVVLGLQYALGASRPSEGIGSQWRPFNDNNAVSGHAFIGAIPFLTAAKMSDSAVWKLTMITFSVLPAWSRVNDNRHYLSQVLMGYSFACLSVWAVDATEQSKRSIMIVPMAVGDGAGVGVSCSF